MAAITPTDLNNAQTDAEKLAEVANSREGGVSTGALIDTTVTRSGDTVDTVNGRLKKLGFLPPVNYAASIVFSVNDQTKTVTYSNSRYAPIVAELPFTTTDWATDESKFYQIDKQGNPSFSTLTGATDQDLAGWGGQSVNSVYRVNGFDAEGDGGGSYWKCTSISATGGSSGLQSDGTYRVDNGDSTFSEFENEAEWFVSGGRKVFFKSFLLTDPDGDQLAFSGGEIEIAASTTRYVYVDVFDKQLRALRFNMHEGAVLIAVVTTDSTNITRVKYNEPALPVSKIPRTKAKIRGNYGTPIIGTLGDSLVDGTGGFEYWVLKLFDSSTTDTTYRLRGVDSGALEWREYALGGSTAHYGLSQVLSINGGGTGTFTNTQVTYLPESGQRNYGLGVQSWAESSIFDCDLVILGFGANGGSGKDEYLEAIIYALRKRGIEVIIVTGNNRTDSVDYQPTNLEVVNRLATMHGCAIADTWCYMRELEDDGTNAHTDVIHQNQLGHDEWAKAVRSVLNDFDTPGAITVSEGRGISDAGAQDQTDLYLSSGYWQFRPINTTGTRDSAATSAASSGTYKNAAIHIAGKTQATSVTTLTSGQYAEFGASIQGAVGLIVDANNSSTIEIYQQNGGSLMKTISVSVTGSISYIEALTHGENANITTDGVSSKMLRFTCTAGTARIIGVVFQSPYLTEIKPSEITQVGTFATESGSYGHDQVLYTDTLNDYAVIKFKGNGIQLLLSNRTASGTVDIYLDGVRIEQNEDLYSTGTFIKPFTIWVNEDDISQGYGEHTLAVKYVSTNGSAITPASGNRRLGIYQAIAMDAR